MSRAAKDASPSADDVHVAGAGGAAPPPEAPWVMVTA